MPTQRKYDAARKAYDYAKCTFKWQWQGPRPPAVARAIEERALRSFGPDAVVMQDRWNRPTVNAKQELENVVFPFQANHDICCADVVGFCGYQTRAVDFVVQKGFNRHWVDTYFPFKDMSQNGGIEPRGSVAPFAEVIGVYGPPGKGGDLPDESKFLPLDYFIYSRVYNWQTSSNHPESPPRRIEAALNGHAPSDTVGDHIDMFLGNFVEVDGGKEVTDGGGTFDLINGSWGLDGSSYYVLALHRYAKGGGEWGLFDSEWSHGTYVVHCRFKAIDRLYREMVGPPLRPPPPPEIVTTTDKDKKAPPPPPPDPNVDLTDFWAQIAAAKAPFPVGTHLGWHQGVHVLSPGDGRDGATEVYPMAPGQVIAARGATPADLTEGSSGFVLMRHLLSGKAKEVVDASAPKGAGGDADPPVAFFTLYMHVAPIATFVDPAAQKDGDAVPPLKEKAPSWLRAIWPTQLPTPVVPARTPITLLSPKDGDASNGYAVVGTPPNLVLPNDVPFGAGLPKAKGADGKEYYVVPQWSDPQQSAWIAQPTPPPATGKLALFNPRTGKVISTTLDPSGFAHLAAKDDQGTLHLVVETVGGVDYAHLDALARPALRKGGGGNDISMTDDPRPDLADRTQSILVLPASASRGDRWDLQLTTTDAGAVKGPAVPLKWADIVDADAETARAKALADAGEPADPAHHTTVGAIEMKLTDDKHHVGYVWVDLVPCVPLQGTKADVESKLNASGKVMARAALDRLEAGLSRLMGVVADAKKDPDWTLDPASGMLTGAGTAAQNPRLYMSVKPYGGRFLVDDNPHKKHTDGAWMLAPPEAKGVALYALATINGAGGTHDALVEVLYGVLASDVDAANKARHDEAKADNDARVQIVQDLLGAKVVDVRDRLATPIRVGREPIAAMGNIVQAPGSDPGPAGIHVEVFAGKPLGLDADATLTDALQPLAGSPWLGMKDAAEDDLLSAKAARHLVTELMKLSTFDPRSLDRKGAEDGGGSWAPPVDATADWPPPTLAEWLSFCTANARLLSRVVAAHPSEWGLRWAESADKDASTHYWQTRDSKDAVAHAHATLEWAKEVKLLGKGDPKAGGIGDGIDDPTAIAFHHPARFIEMLRTGIEVSVSTHDPDAAAKAKVTFTPTGQSAMTLVQGGAPGRFVARVPISEIPGQGAGQEPGVVGVVDVKFDGQAKPFSRTMLVARGVTTRMTVVSAWVDQGVEWPTGGRPYAIDVGERPAPLVSGNVIHFLADGGKSLGSFGYGQVKLRVGLSYNNLSKPSFSDPSLGGGAGFSVALVKDTNKKDITVSIPDPPKPGALPTTDFTSVTASVEVGIASQATTIGASDTVSITVTSDELVAPSTLKWTLQTRTITKKLSGPDVAQLQLYLGEILAADGLPCYRNDLAASGKPGIDGEYGPGLRMALWRFCYTYASTDAGTNWVAKNIAVTQGTASSTVTADALEKISKKWWVAFEKPESPADGDQDVVAWATRTQTVKLDDAAAEWPVVDLPLVQSVVAIFAEGHEVPYIEAVLTPQRPSLPAARADGPNVTLVDVKNIKDGLARGLPWPDFHVYGTFNPEGQPGAGAKDGTILIEVPDDGPYKLVHNGVTASSFSVPSSEVFVSQLSFELTPVAGVHWTKAEHFVMKATWTGGKKWLISQRQLQEPRNFAQKWEADGDVGIDVTLVQFCLSQAPFKNPDKAGNIPVGFLPPPPKARGKATATDATTKASVVIDGKWTSGWVGALSHYVAEWIDKSGKIDSDTVIPKLLAHILKGQAP